MSTVRALVWTVIATAATLKPSLASVSDADRQLIIDRHNMARSEVDPPSTGTFKLYWNDSLAAAAQSWADGCHTEPQEDLDRTMAVGLGVRVNAISSVGPASCTETLDEWVDEGEHFVLNEENPEFSVEHYTHMVQTSAMAMGCGSKNNCPGIAPLHICYYTTFVSFYSPMPYAEGPSCELCPNNCTDNLCDCGPKVCQNGGMLNRDSCSCQCLPWASGEYCEIQNCNDPIGCEMYSEPGECEIYPDYIPFVCPVMCHLCE